MGSALESAVAPPQVPWCMQRQQPPSAPWATRFWSWSGALGTSERSTKQNYSSLNISTVTGLLYNTASCETGGNLPLHETRVSSLPCPAEKLKHGATHHCHCYLGGTQLREGLRGSKQGAFPHKDVGNVVSWPLLTPLIQLCIRDRSDTAVLGGAKSLRSFTLLKVCAGKYQHRGIFLFLSSALLESLSMGQMKEIKTSCGWCNPPIAPTAQSLLRRSRQSLASA